MLRVEGTCLRKTAAILTLTYQNLLLRSLEDKYPAAILTGRCSLKRCVFNYFTSNVVDKTE